MGSRGKPEVWRDGPLVKRSRHRPLTPETGVQFPHGSPTTVWQIDKNALVMVIYMSGKEEAKEGNESLISLFTFFFEEGILVGVYDDEGPPVPIPNTVVKLIGAHNTWLVTAWKDRSMPTQYSSIAQLVEHAAVNRRVVGSSPTWGARSLLPPCKCVAAVNY